MSKKFFEVFPTLKVNEELELLFHGVDVCKVATNKRRDYIRVQIRSGHLIRKSRIYELEELLKEQLFGRARIQIRVEEEFSLSAQYTPENIMSEYYESFLEELDRVSVVERNMLQNADISFSDGNILCLKLEDSIVAQGKKESLCAYLEEVYRERFGCLVEVRVLYERKAESRLKYNEEKLRQEVEAILEETEAAREEKAGEEKPAKPASKPAERGGRNGYRRRENGERKSGTTWGKSDDPNQIYGRFFDDEPIELVQVVSEMGEITLRGKIIKFETREIRNEKTIVMFAVTDFTDTIIVKMFVRNDQLADILAEIRPGAFIKLKGVTTIDKFDGELTIGSVTGIRKIPDFTESRKDTAPEKRVLSRAFQSLSSKISSISADWEASVSNKTPRMSSRR